MASGQGSGYKDTWLWNLGFSAYWFATSYKWFILLLVVLPGQVFNVFIVDSTNEFKKSLQAVGAAQGNTVVTTEHTYDGALDAIKELGATHVEVEVGENAKSIDFQLLEAAVTPDTVAISTVYINHKVVGEDEVQEIADRHGLVVVDDPAIAADKVKNSKYGLLVFFGGIWALFGPMIFGGWSDRLRTKWGHRQPFLAAGAGLTVLALFVLADAQAFWVLIVGYLLLQFSDDVGTGPYSAMVPEIVPEEKRGRASSVMSMLQLFGQIGSSVAALVIYGAVKDPVAAIKTIYLGVGVTNVLCAFLTIYTIRKVRPDEEAQKDDMPFFKKWIRPFKSADFRWVWFTRLLSALGFFLVSTYLRNYMDDGFTSFNFFGNDLGSSSNATNILGLTISITGAAGAAVAAKYSDAWGRKRLIYVAGVIIFCVMVPFSLVRDFQVAWALACVFGAAYGMYLSADWALVSDVIPNKKAAGIEMGVWASSIVSVQLLSGLYGSVIDWGNARSASGLAGYMSAIVLAGCVFLLGTVLVKQVKGSR